MLAHHLKRWASSKPALGHGLVLAGEVHILPVSRSRSPRREYRSKQWCRYSNEDTVSDPQSMLCTGIYVVNPDYVRMLLRHRAQVIRAKVQHRELPETGPLATVRVLDVTWSQWGNPGIPELLSSLMFIRLCSVHSLCRVWPVAVCRGCVVASQRGAGGGGGGRRGSTQPWRHAIWREGGS